MDIDRAALLIKAIVSGQSLIIGPIAIEQANKVPGIQVSSDLSVVKVSEAGKEVLEKLVRQYERLFGRASVEACRDTVRESLPPVSEKDLPDILK